MSDRHPVDEAGRAIPVSSWPPDKQAPDGLEFVRRFCNTTNLESGADRLAESADFGAWLIAEGQPDFAADTEALDRAARIRETIRAAAIAHRAGRDDTEAMQALEHLTAHVPLRITIAARPMPLGPAADVGDIDHVIGQLTARIIGAVHDGTWTRLKACQNCGWVVYDSSKNRSTRWCSMTACGGRAKVRNHRARQRSAPPVD